MFCVLADLISRRYKMVETMTYITLGRTLLVLFGMALVTACSSNNAAFEPGRQGSASPNVVSGKYIKHIVLMVQENRSFDDFFATYPGADGATYGYTSKGVKVTLKKSPLAAADINHDWKTFLAECDLQSSGICKMDGFDKAKIGGNNPGGLYAYQYVDPTKLVPYWTIAKDYVLLDHMFQTQGSGSFTAHQDLIAGATAIDQTNSLIDFPNEAKVWGCDAPTPSPSNPYGTYVPLITVNDAYEGDPSKYKLPFPCLTYGTMRDLLDAKKVGWKYYTPTYDINKTRGGAGTEWNAFAAIQAVRYGSEWGVNVVWPETQVCSDIASGKLPAFSWVIPDQVDSDHPQSKNQQDDGPDWIASVVNAIGKSPYWNSTAIVIVWDDWGGFFDHVPPKFYSSGQLGFRVPALIVSPYVAQGNVSHVPFEFGSILKFAEQTLGLGSLGTTDVRAKSIGDVFNFTKPARSFESIPTQRSCDYFLHRPPSNMPVDTE